VKEKLSKAMKWLKRNKKEIIVVVCAIVISGSVITMRICFWNEVLEFLNLLKTDAADNVTILIATVIGFVVPIVTLLIIRHKEEKLRIKQEHTKKTIEFYETIIEIMKKDMEIKKTVESSKGLPLEFQKEIAPKISQEKIDLRTLRINFRRMLIAWGSEDVIKKCNNFLETEKPSDEETLNFLKFIRKEIGHQDVDIEDQVLIDLFKKD
jgi:hypothetical protein